MWYGLYFLPTQTPATFCATIVTAPSGPGNQSRSFHPEPFTPIESSVKQSRNFILRWRKAEGGAHGMQAASPPLGGASVFIVWGHGDYIPLGNYSCCCTGPLGWRSFLHAVSYRHLDLCDEHPGLCGWESFSVPGSKDMEKLQGLLEIAQRHGVLFPVSLDHLVYSPELAPNIFDSIRIHVQCQQIRF